MNIDIFELPGILRRRIRYVVITAIATTILALLVTMRMTPIYTASTELLLDPLGLLADGTAGQTAAAAPQQDEAGLDSQVYVVQSRNVLDRVVRDLDLTNDPYLLPAAVRQKLSPEAAVAATSGALKTHLSVQRAGQSLVLVIAVQHRDATKAAEITNAVANTYLAQIDEARADAARRASAAFQGQAGELRDRVAKAEAAVETFRAENGLASAGSAGLVIDQQVAGLNQQLIAARGEEEQKQTIYEQSKNLTAATVQAGGIPEALKSPGLDALRQRYIALLDRQAQLETTLADGHPQVKAIRSQVANMRSAIEQELARIQQSVLSDYQRASANTKALQRRLDALTRQSFNSGEAQIKMRQLQSEAEAVQALYKSFLNRAAELGQQESLKTNNSRVITAANIPGGGSKKLVKLLVIVAGALFGLILGAGLAVLRELGATLLPERIVETVSPARTGRRKPSDVLAVLPNTSSSGTRQKLPFLGQRGADAKPSKRWANGINRITDKVAERTGRKPASTLLFVSAGPLSAAAAAVVPDVVEALTELGNDIRYAPGTLVERRARVARPAIAGVRRPSLLAALDSDDEASGAGIMARLLFQYFPAATPGRTPSNRPTFSRFMGSVVSPDAMTIINGCGTPAADLVDQLVLESDGVVIIEEGDAADWSDADDLFGERLIGRVVVGKRD